MTRSSCLVKYVIFGAFASAFCLLEGCALKNISQGLGMGGGGLLWLISAGFVLLASQNPFLIIVYSEAKII